MAKCPKSEEPSRRNEAQGRTQELLEGSGKEEGKPESIKGKGGNIKEEDWWQWTAEEDKKELGEDNKGEILVDVLECPQPKAPKEFCKPHVSTWPRMKHESAEKMPTVPCQSYLNDASSNTAVKVDETEAF